MGHPTQQHDAVAPNSPQIVVVDDDGDIRDLFDALLTGAGYHTRLFATSTHAMAAIQEAPPDLIILDIWLEQADDGWELLNALRHQGSTRAIPVIVCSAHAFLLGTMADLRSAPHYAFVAKPFAVDVLLGQVHRLLQGVTPAAPAIPQVDQG